MGSCCCEFNSAIEFSNPWVDWVVGGRPSGSAVDKNVVGNRFQFGATPLQYSNKPAVTCCDHQYRFYAPLRPAFYTDLAIPPKTTHCIVRFTRDFTLELSVPAPVSGTMPNGAQAVDVDADGNMYATNGREAVYKFDKDGNLVWESALLHPSSASSNYLIFDIAVDLNGNVAVVGWYDTDEWWVVLLDSDGAEVWQAESSSGLFRDAVRGECVCFDEDGNVYVGFRPQSYFAFPLGVNVDYRWAAAFAAADGAELWMKTKLWTSVTTSSQFAGDICFSQAGKQLAIIGYYCDRTGGGNGEHSSFVDVYSGTNFATLDFTATQQGSANSPSTPTELCFGAWDTQGRLWAGNGFQQTNGRAVIYDSLGTVLGTLNNFTTAPGKLCLTPGTHPIFL